MIFVFLQVTLALVTLWQNIDVMLISATNLDLNSNMLSWFQCLQPNMSCDVIICRIVSLLDADIND